MPRGDPIFRQERTELDFKNVGLHRSVPSLGRLLSSKAHLPWDYTKKRPMQKSQERHEGIIEVHYIASGSQALQIADKEYHARGGDLIVTLPGEQHGTGELVAWERVLIYWMRLRVPRKDKGGKFLNFPKKLISPMLDKLSGVHPEARVFKASLQLQHFFDNVILAEAHAEAGMKPLVVSLGLLDLLVEIVRCIEAGQGEKKRRDIAAVLKYIDEHIQDGPEAAALLTNDKLASQANLSRAGFQIKFRQQTGMSPAEYVQRRKIEQATSLLATGLHSVTDVAFSLGFSSSQYFSTVFKKYTNKHPRDYLS